jgi:hypothetical protein
MSQLHHTTVEKISATNRSRVTNARLRGNVSARSLFVDGDGRTPWARRYRDLVGLLCDDAGSVETLTELKLSLIRRAAALIVECERMENALANGETVDVDLLARLSSHVRRISESIGLDRVKRDVTPTIAELVAKHNAAKPVEKPAESAKPVAAATVAPTMPALASDRAAHARACLAADRAANRAEPIEAAS